MTNKKKHKGGFGNNERLHRQDSDLDQTTTSQIDREKMKQAGIKNMSAYIRKMAIDGYVIRLDTSELSEISRLLRINSNNLNQIAKRANETGSIYINDIKELKVQQDEILVALEKVYDGFLCIYDKELRNN